MGRARFVALWSHRPDFLPCALCPHEPALELEHESHAGDEGGEAFEEGTAASAQTRAQQQQLANRAGV